MKKQNYLLFFLLSFCPNGINAQSTANFTASVTIVEPIGITTVSNMNFANIDAQGGGTVIISPENTREATGTVRLQNEEKLSAATFIVTGEQDSTFSIHLPATDYILSSGGEKMVINEFTSSLTTNNSLDKGSKTFKVGATLVVNAHQKPGTYTSLEPLKVSVNYN